jgi:hypothetical protein
MAGIRFGVISRKALSNGSFKSLEEPGQAIKDFCKAYNLDPKPFVRRKREVMVSQLRNTVKNLCN